MAAAANERFRPPMGLCVVELNRPKPLPLGRIDVRATVQDFVAEVCLTQDYTVSLHLSVSHLQSLSLSHL